MASSTAAREALPLSSSVTSADRDPASASPFEVHLANFEGPFDLLLSLIAKHQMDVTLVALSQVTDEFIAHIRALGNAWDLGQATEFLVVAATLLDLKAARLLPAGEVDDEEDLALLEARDLLFARLLQYRAYKLAAGILSSLAEAELKHHARAVSLEPRFAAALPEVIVGIGPAALAALAAAALVPRSAPTVSLDHIHAPRVSVREHLLIVAERLQAVGTASFRALCAGCDETIEVVARFLAVLELYREGAVVFEQVQALAELRVRWCAAPGAIVGRHLDGDHAPEFVDDATDQQANKATYSSPGSDPAADPESMLDSDDPEGSIDVTTYHSSDNSAPAPGYESGYTSGLTRGEA